MGSKVAKVIVGNRAERANKFAGEAGNWIGQGEVLATFDGPIPVNEVDRLLFNWEAVEVPSANLIPVSLDQQFDTIIDGQAYKVVVVPDKKAIVRSDDFSEMGRHSQAYPIHHYSDWLLRKVSNVVQGRLLIDNAGALRNGAQAFVTITLDHDMHDGESGLDFRPFLLASTSLDGSLATTYSNGVRLPICDNMHQGFHKEAKAAGRQFRAKHTRWSNSANVIAGAREALAIMDLAAQQTVDQFHQLLAVPVSRPQWLKVLDVLEPAAGSDASKVKVTKTENRREALDEMYSSNPMSAPWIGTAFGVVQAVNTYSQHVANVRGMTRVERVYDRAVKGEFAENDLRTLEALSTVLERDLIPA